MKHRIQNFEYTIQPRHRTSGCAWTLKLEKGDDAVGGTPSGSDRDGRAPRKARSNGRHEALKREKAAKRSLEPSWGGPYPAKAVFYRLATGYYRIGAGFYRIIYRILPAIWRFLPRLAAYYRILPHNVFLATKRGLDPIWGRENHGDTVAQRQEFWRIGAEAARERRARSRPTMRVG
jgi:hypothetical protein